MPKLIRKFKIVTGDRYFPEDLEERVNKYLQDGYPKVEGIFQNDDIVDVCLTGEYILEDDGTERI